MDRAVEKDLYGIWAGDSSGYQSARAIGAESPGMLRAMIAYMGYTEGIPHEVINQLDAMIGTDNEAAVSELFARYVKQYEGINDRELAQRRALQVHQWQMTQQQMQDKKADWDRMVKRIFERGIRQWDMMLKGFASRWKNWQEESEESMVKGAKQWDETMQRLREEKLQWLADAYSGVSYKELLKRMAGIEVVVTDMLATIKEQYGDAIGKVDVHAILVDIIKDQPQLLSSELMAMTKQQVEFGLTRVSVGSYNRSIFDDAQMLGKEYATVQKKTQNIALLKALTQLLEQCREQIEAANEQAEQAALQFVSAYAFGIDGNRYKRTLAITSTRQTIPAYQPFVYTDSLLLGEYSIPVLMDIYNKDDGVQFEATMNVVMAQAQTRMGMMMRPDVVWGFSYYVGQFGQIKPGPKLKEGKGQYGRITKDVYEAEKEKATQDAICQYVNAGIGVALSAVTANPMVGAAYVSVGQAGDIAAGDLSLQHWAVQTGISMGASYAGGVVEESYGAVLGSLTSSGIQGLGNFVEYKDNGGLGLQWGSKAQWRSWGIGSTTALVGAVLGEAYGEKWNNSWQQYGYTASSSYVVNRFDGTGSWKDDMLQAGASVAALWASNALLADGTAIGQSASSHNAVLPMNRFMQGTLENAILAGADMMKGKGMHDALLYQNWEKTQYRAADWLSDWAAQQGRQDAEDWKTNQKKEGILGLAWLGLSKAGSLLSGAWDSVSEFFEKGINWVQGEGFYSNKEIADNAAFAAFHKMAVKEAFQKRAQEILDSFYKDSREVTDAKKQALKEAGYDTTQLEAEIARRRQALEEKKALTQHKEQKKNVVEIKETDYYDVDDYGDGKDWVKFKKEGEGFKDYCLENQQDHKYVAREFAEIVSDAIDELHDKTGKTLYVNDFSPEPGKKSEFGHHDRDYDRGYVVDIKWVSKDDKIYAGDYDNYKNLYDRESTLKLIESFIESSKTYLNNNGNRKMIIYYNDTDVMENIKNKYIDMIKKNYLSIKYATGHSNHIHIGLYNRPK
ncbi:MAG TPA: hypothetical protein PLH80_06390 [Spirochaetota bacterium]|nr:hypothetical protein [Spirochaetota bacterium]HPD05641.1 hypothetical protein [Spirochaetota bacterium]HQI38171.1 hypothetical protein [Spirochaetota bacterium]